MLSATTTCDAPLRPSRRQARLERQSIDDQPLVEPVLTPAEPFELLEPANDLPAASADDIVEEPAADEPVTLADQTAEGDAFEAAARLFSFTGETPVQENAQGDAEPGAEASAPHVAPRRAGRGRALKRLVTASFSVGVVGVVGLLTVGLTTPASAVAAAQGAAGASFTNVTAAKGSDVVTGSGNVAIDPDDIQVYVAPADIENAALDRNEGYSIASMADLASEFAIARPSDFYVNDMNAAIQWPFAVGVAITWGFVMRDGRMHNGADFVPGEGAHVQAVADGTVRIATENGGGFGVTVLIDHIIDGELVSSRYAHMLRGSLQVQQGDTVKVGQYLGRTGNTGRSFGAHTHFEILANGTTPIDPIAWLRQNAGRDSLG